MTIIVLSECPKGVPLTATKAPEDVANDLEATVAELAKQDLLEGLPDVNVHEIHVEVHLRLLTSRKETAP